MLFIFWCFIRTFQQDSAPQQLCQYHLITNYGCQEHTPKIFALMAGGGLEMNEPTTMLVEVGEYKTMANKQCHHASEFGIMNTFT